MKIIVAHCDKTIVKTEDHIKDTETHLKDVTERQEYQSIEQSIKQDFKKHKQVLYKVLTTLTPFKYR